ncbi:TPA: hypothetical protein H5X26_004993 [Escherichia coli]|nr:hypothetical protein [Escherichia coli]
MKKNQLEAVKQLEAALLRIKHAGLVLCGIDSNLHVTVNDAALQDEMRTTSPCEAVLARANGDHEDTDTVKHYGAYLDSGGA